MVHAQEVETMRAFCVWRGHGSAGLDYGEDISLLGAAGSGSSDAEADEVRGEELESGVEDRRGLVVGCVGLRPSERRPLSGRPNSS